MHYVFIKTDKTILVINCHIEFKRTGAHYTESGTRFDLRFFMVVSKKFYLISRTAEILQKVLGGYNE
jgi:hypothetical protein